MLLKPPGVNAVKKLIHQVKSIHPGDNPFGHCLPIFVIVGQPGAGRTTLVTNLVQRLRDDVPSRKIQGFYTSELRDGGDGDRMGYEVVTFDGNRALFAHVDESKITTGNTLVPVGKRYKVDVASFEKLVLPSLKIHRDTDLFVIDEIGRLELTSPHFFPAVLKIIQSRIPVVISMPPPRRREENLPEVEHVANLRSTVYCFLSNANQKEYERLVFILLNRVV